MPDPIHHSQLIAALARAGQSLWYDGLRRELIASGGLARLAAAGEPYRKLLVTIQRRREAALSAHP